MTTIDEKKVVSKYTIAGSITAATLAGAAVNSIVGYIAVYFFAPVWKKIARTWEEKEQENNEQDTN